MNKNPFIPQPGYPQPQQPPLPPGPPPPGQPQQQADYSAYWAAHSSQAYNPQQQQQWTAPQPASRPAPPPPPPTAEQSALYANYGYGGQAALHWQQQQPRPGQPPPQVQQQPMVYHAQPAPQVAAGYPYPPPVAGYYGPPTAGPVYQQQPMQAQQQVQYYPPQQQQQPMQMHHGPQQPQMQQMQPQMQTPQRHNHGVYHTPPHQLPPAKRQRFDGPPQGPQRGGSPFQPQIPPGGTPSGPAARGGMPARGGSRGGSMIMPSGGRGRGGAQSTPSNRGGGGGGRGRGGGSMQFNNNGSNDRGRGGTPIRGQGSRGTFNNSRRGGGGGSSASFTGPTSGSNAAGGGSFRARGSRGGGRNQSDVFGARGGESSMSFGGMSKKDENRRTLTDFKIVGLEIPGLAWSWGIIPSVKDKEDVVPTRESTPVPTTADEPVVKPEETSDIVPVQPGTETEPNTQVDLPVELGNIKTEPTQLILDEATQPLEELTIESQEAAPKPEAASDPVVPPPPSRVRIYFHTPVSPDDARFVPTAHGNASTSAAPGDGRKGKRKKLEEDDEESDTGRAKRPAPHITAPSGGDDNASTSEPDWLMASSVTADDVSSTGDAEATTLVILDEDGDASDQDDGLTEIAHSPRPEPDGDDHAQSEHDVDEHHLDSELDLVVAGIRDLDGDAAPIPDAASVLPEAPKDIVLSETSVESVAEPSIVVLAPTLSDIEDEAKDDSRPPIVDTIEAVEGQTSDANTSSDPQTTTLLGTGAVDSSLSAPPSLPIESTSPTISETNTSVTQDPAVSADMQAVDQDHLPEPPASPASNTLLSTSSGSTYGGDTVQSHPSSPLKMDGEINVNFGDLALKPVPVPSANRISISYAGGTRRLVIDAGIVERLKVFRAEGRIEVTLTVERLDESGFKGIFVEGLCDTSKSYLPLEILTETSAADPTIPAFELATDATQTILQLHLDKERPLSEPKWVKSGDVQEWLRSILGRMFWVAGDAADSWEKKIEVADPDPPPTIWTVLDAWVANSPAGTQTERQRFYKTHIMIDHDNILEILLRLVRGERATPFASAPSATNVTAGPLIAAITPGSSHGSQQSHVSLAVLAMVQMAREYAIKAEGESGKKEVEDRIGELIRCLPQHLVYKSLDGIFKEWKLEKKGGY